MAGMCRGVNIGGETEASIKPVEPISVSARRRRMEIHRFNFVPNDSTVAPPPLPNGRRLKRRRSCGGGNGKVIKERRLSSDDQGESTTTSSDPGTTGSGAEAEHVEAGVEYCPKFGVTSVCGRRRDMEDAVAVHPSFCNRMHFFGVYDGHGCSHVANRCNDRMHEIVRDVYESRSGASESSSSSTWEATMSESFSKMDKEVVNVAAARTTTLGEVSRDDHNNNSGVPKCRCGLQTPQCDAVGSTAVVAVVTPDKIIVSNCGDSRAVLCRNGVAVPLSQDHKPDRPDELNRIEEAGGRVIFWDGPRVLGVLAMSRAIGDSYLKPYVTSDPEVTVVPRTSEDECLILASDGLWDVVSNETACGVARMCIQSRKPPSPPRSPGSDVTVTERGESSDKACSDASILLTKLALARHSTDNVSVVVVDLRRRRS